MTNRHEGPIILKKYTHGQLIKGYAKVFGKDVLPNVKIRKVRAEETEPRKKYDRAEDKLRPLIIKEFRRLGYATYRVENSISGRRNSGLGDLFVLHVGKGFSAWVEIKTPIGVLSDVQRVFRSLCDQTDMKYVIVRSVEDVKEIK